jgi:hypothetical protein
MKAGSAQSARGEAGAVLLQALRMSEVPENQSDRARKMLIKQTIQAPV